jgi:hypothetical protein
MLVLIDPYKYGGYVLRPKSPKLTAQILIDVVLNGGPGHKSVLIQEEDLEVLALSPRTSRELKHGYSVCCIMDNWLVRRLYGYCKD